MKRAAIVIAALAVAFAAPAAPVRTATESFVTNKIAEAIAALPASGVDAATATNIAQAAAAAATNGIPRITESDVFEGWAAKAEDSLHADEASNAVRAEEAERANFADEASHAVNADGAESAYLAEEASIAYALHDLAFGGNKRQSYEIFTQLDAATETNAAQTAKLAEVPHIVTNIVRDISLGGIWDETLQVWWTPRMRNGSLTYEATTNVNLNAEN